MCMDLNLPHSCISSSQAQVRRFSKGQIQSKCPKGLILIQLLTHKHMAPLVLQGFFSISSIKRGQRLGQQNNNRNDKTLYLYSELGRGFHMSSYSQLLQKNSIYFLFAAFFFIHLQVFSLTTSCAAAAHSIKQTEMAANFTTTEIKSETKTTVDIKCCEIQPSRNVLW